jgi:hypothetical protein
MYDGVYDKDSRSLGAEGVFREVQEVCVLYCINTALNGSVNASTEPSIE